MTNSRMYWKTLQLKTPGYVAGIELNGQGIAMRSAPILRWMLGKHERWILHHCKKHNIIVTEVENGMEPPDGTARTL